jgi:hypothetical protein
MAGSLSNGRNRGSLGTTNSRQAKRLTQKLMDQMLSHKVPLRRQIRGGMTFAMR